MTNQELNSTQIIGRFFIRACKDFSYYDEFVGWFRNSEYKNVNDFFTKAATHVLGNVSYDAQRYMFLIETINTMLRMSLERLSSIPTYMMPKIGEYVYNKAGKKIYGKSFEIQEMYSKQDKLDFTEFAKMEYDKLKAMGFSDDFETFMNRYKGVLFGIYKRTRQSGHSQEKDIF